MSTASVVQEFQVGVTVFNITSFIAVFSLTLVVATAHFSPTVHRSGLWFQHMISWILYSVSFVLLVTRQLGPEPPFGLCLMQASLVHAVPVLPTLSAFCFVVDLYIGLSAVVYKKRKIRPTLSKFLLKLPQTVFIGVFLVVLLAIQDSGIVSRNADHLYCHVTASTPSIVSASLVVGTGLFIFPLEIWIAVVLCRNWVTFRHCSNPRQDPQVSLTMFIRVALFTVMSMTGVGLSSLSLADVPKPYWSLVLPIVPIIAAVTFGSQEDIMKSMVFWREPEPISPPTSKEATDTVVEFGMRRLIFDSRS
ncbi:hypothetical protein C8R43DRAFT_93055 [Mycena crocata]|nr:hypothetical protein C8R43DRAFT_93055 [Mycena crocata]